MWTCLAATLLPTSAAVLGFLWYSKVRTEPLAGLGLAAAIHIWWPVPLFALIGFAFALEWKQGLGERIKKLRDELTSRVFDEELKFGRFPCNSTSTVIEMVQGDLDSPPSQLCAAPPASLG